jgi:hypothetical protein
LKQRRLTRESLQNIIYTLLQDYERRGAGYVVYMTVKALGELLFVTNVDLDAPRVRGILQKFVEPGNVGVGDGGGASALSARADAVTAAAAAAAGGVGEGSSGGESGNNEWSQHANHAVRVLWAPTFVETQTRRAAAR